MVKVVINVCFGGFSLSKEAYAHLGLEWDGYGYKYDDDEGDFRRYDPKLVKCVEELGDKASGAHAELKVVEIPDDVEWKIDEYDGNEEVHEVHRVWR